MDWSAVYDNHGEEEGRWEERGEAPSSRLARRLLRRTLSFSFTESDDQPGKYSSFVAYTFTVNYILGVGSLGIPFAFHRAGLVLGNGLILLVSLLSYITVMWICETIARVRQHTSYNLLTPCEHTRLRLSEILPGGFHGLGVTPNAHTVRTPAASITTITTTNANSNSNSSNNKTLMMALTPTTLHATPPSTSGLNPTTVSYSNIHVPMSNRLTAYEDFPEVTQLCDRFLGPVGSKLYQLSLLGLMYGGLLGYSQVFVNSFLSQVEHFDKASMLHSWHGAMVFGIIVIPLSCSDLTEQIGVQLCMSMVRFLALLIMISGACFAIYHDPFDVGNRAVNGTAMGSPPYLSDYSLVDFTGFGVMFSTAVFSQLFQHSVPGLIAPLSTRNRKKTPVIFGSTLLTTCVFYLALGTVCSMYFGDKVFSSVNLNWANFTWGLAAKVSQIPFWAKCLSMLVVMFPALDTLSVYPLIAITLGDNMASVLPKHLKTKHNRTFWKLVCRLMASCPPLVIAVFVRDLSITLQLSGIFGIYVAFFAPALLQWYACHEFPQATMYTSCFSGMKTVVAVLVFGLFALLVLVAQFLDQHWW